jgi:ribulose bisphosphate carboxylase small subunit
VAHFEHQSIDFFGALRSRLYDEQVRTFIRQVGIERVSAHLVNNPDKTLKTARAEVSLARLIELGQQMVEEQSRLERSRLAQSYTSGEPINLEVAKSIPSSPQNVDSLNSTEQPLEYHAPTNETQDWPKGIALGEIERSLERALRQGGRLSLEIASPREKAGNIWRSWPWSQAPENATKAVESILDCIKANPNRFIKLIGYNPQTQTRLLEEMIVRPQ